VWETFVFSELRKRVSFQDKPISIWFYRDQRGREIDFVLDSGSQLSYLEAKWSEHPDQRDTRSILAVSGELEASNAPWAPGQHYVIGTPGNSYPIGGGVSAIGVSHLGMVLV
jgi:predicted AAA+ superfamily ATPase